jgi:hypothetical protein
MLADRPLRRVKRVNERGCSESRRKLLLRCPRCSWLYEVSPTGPRDAIHLTPAEAAARFRNYQQERASATAASTRASDQLLAMRRGIMRSDGRSLSARWAALEQFCDLCLVVRKTGRERFPDDLRVDHLVAVCSEVALLAHEPEPDLRMRVQQFIG